MFDITKATEEQKQVLLEKDKNILVSAAAGSGKTTVMIEKIVRLILETKVSIENFLVLTFTKASAEDMKNKLIARLSFETMSPFILEQIDSIPVSDVSNLHSFCARLLKSYFYAIGLDPTFSVIDEVQQSRLKERALDKLFDGETKQGNVKFFEIADIFQNSRKDAKLREQILKIYEFSKSQVDFDEWFHKTLNDSYTTDLNKNKCSEIIKNYAKNIVYVFKDEIANLKARMVSELHDDDTRKKLTIYLDSLDTKLSMLKFRDSFEVFADSVRSVGKYDTIPKVVVDYDYWKNECLKIKVDIKSRVDTISGAIFSEPDSTLDSVKKCLVEIREYVLTMFDLTRKFDEIYLALKKEIGALDFNDLEMFALNVLEDREVLEEVKNKYKYIFVDEYQDINSVQEKIITLISKENNRFMVGDIKQSIYGFRLCDPEIFLQKYNDYKVSGTKSTSISLNKNFRSHQDILEFVNMVFDDTMTKSFGGVDYKDEARLVAGKTAEEKDSPRATIMFVDTTSLEKTNDGENIKDLGVYSVKNHEYIETLDNKKAYLEGMVVANKISELVSSSKYKIIDKETRKERQIMFKDIVILVHSRNEYLNNLLDVLDSVQIPISSDITSDVFEDEDILALKNMLLVISNEAQDKPLFALMYSNLFKFTPDELSRIKLCGQYKYFYEHVTNFDGDEKLLEKVTAFWQTIERYKKLASFVSVKNLCYKIIDEFCIEKNMIASHTSAERLAKLGKFLSSLPDDLLTEFLANSDISTLACECKTSSNSVKVMTIHKSKGLEFPVVFLVGTSNKFNMKSVYGDLHVSKELGICMNYFNTKERYKTSSLSRSASKIIENKKFFEEEQRLLYVALTRAIDYLFVSGCAKKDSLPEKFSPTPMSFMEWFAPILLNPENENSSIFDIEEYDVSDIPAWNKSENQMPVLIGRPNDTLVHDLKKTLEYVYPYEEQTRTPQKTTVTKIVEATRLYEKPSQPETSNKMQVVNSAERGTAYHKVLEQMTLLENSVEEVQNIIAGLYKKKILTNDQVMMIDPQKLLDCVCDKSFRNDVLNATWIKKETEFYMLIGQGERKDMVEVQGIADLIIKSKNEVILYDYKTGYLTEALANHKYKAQLDLYKMAVERIFGTKITKSCIIAVDMGQIFNIK